MPTSNTDSSSSDTRANVNNHQDGGFIALRGFLFQFLTTLEANIKFSSLSGPSREANSGDDEILFGFEISDSDGVQAKGNLVKIIQVKSSYAQEDANTVISPKEANEIFEKMWAFAEENYPEDQGWECQFELYTNRKKSPHLSDIYAGVARKYYETYPDLRKYVNEAKWILVDREKCWQKIEEWGKSFGMIGGRSTGEIHSGVGRIWSRFLNDVSDRRGWITRKEFEQIFTDYESPTPFNSLESRLKVEDDTSRFLRDLDFSSFNNMLIMRQELLSSIQSWIEQGYIVIIEGLGGCGKSVIIGLLVKQLANDAFVSGRQAINLGHYWPSHSVSKWRNRLPFTNEPTGQALYRLPRDWRVNPVAVFALDGLDEAFYSQHIAPSRELFAEFRDLAPELTQLGGLVITCRKVEDIPDLVLLAKDEVRCKVVPVKEFSNGELLRALSVEEIGLDVDIKKQLNSMISLLQRNEKIASSYTPATSIDVPGQMSASDEGDAPFNDSQLAKEVVTSLRHPVVWGQFCSRELDAESRGLILGNQDEGWRVLAGKIFEWFCDKYVARQIPQQGTREMVNDLLIDIASRCSNDSKWYYRSDWVGGHTHNVMYYGIYAHAITSGVIDIQDKRGVSEKWRWRHPFLVRYLARLKEQCNE